MKLRKKIAAMCAATVMALGALCIEASAYGTVTYDGASGLSGNYNLSFSYSNVDGNKSSATSSGEHYGQRGTPGFTISTSGNYRVYFCGASGTSAKLKIYKVVTIGSNTSTSLQTTINIPHEAPGMGTQSALVNLPSGNYFFKSEISK